MQGYAAFNPHAALALVFKGERTEFAPTACEWEKWLPKNPTSTHWYSVERLRALIAAYLAGELDGGRVRTVRELVAEFNGMSGSTKQKAVTAVADLSGATLRDLVHGDDVDLGKVERLLAALQDQARPVKPQALGILGKPHLSESLIRHYYAADESVRYEKAISEADGLPFVLEVALGVKREDYAGYGRDVVVGLNWSPTLRSPLTELDSLLGENRVDRRDPVSLVVHLACPRLEYTDRGKSRLALPSQVQEALAKCVRSVTKPWKEQKRQADRQDRLNERQLEDMRKAQKRREWSIREAAYHVMKDAYLKASGNGAFPANARQIMYAARGPVLRLTGGKPWKKSSYFTQHLLPDFVEEHPDLAADWDVVFDARGRLIEPHTARRTDLGTLEVRRYIKGWRQDVSEAVEGVTIDVDYPTVGPHNRYQYALFIEKEGFYAHFESANIANRYDVAIMSTKGMSVTAARQLVERLSEEGVTVLVLRDFDKSGFSIVHTLQNDTRRYRFKTRPRVIDLGLRLTDVQDMGLESERVVYDSDADPRRKLRECGATLDECNFLVQGQPLSGGWVGERVELNAMDSPQFIAWVERKLEEVGVKKVVPDQETLAKAYRRAQRRAHVQEAIDRAIDEMDDADIEAPEDLEQLVTAEIEGKAMPWDLAVWKLVRDQRERDQQKGEVA